MSMARPNRWAKEFRFFFWFLFSPRSLHFWGFHAIWLTPHWCTKKWQMFNKFGFFKIFTNFQTFSFWTKHCIMILQMSCFTIGFFHRNFPWGQGRGPGAGAGPTTFWFSHVFWANYSQGHLFGNHGKSQWSGRAKARGDSKFYTHVDWCFGRNLWRICFCSEGLRRNIQSAADTLRPDLCATIVLLNKRWRRSDGTYTTHLAEVCGTLCKMPEHFVRVCDQ